MKDLFYSEKDKMLFWIAGYTKDNNVSNVYEMTQSLMENAMTFAGYCGCDVREVRTRFISSSSRYKYMRVFFIENPKIIPASKFDLGTDWTMEKWITK